MDHCLRAFTSEEKLEEGYYCGHCKNKMPATKKLQIWKLPPILIVHLKRFNFVNNKWVKSQKVVNFPFKDFDPTPYLASVPQETILRHKDINEHSCIRPTQNISSSSSSFDSDETAIVDTNFDRSIDDCIEEDVSSNENESNKNDIVIKSNATKEIHGVNNPIKKRISTTSKRLNEDTLTRRKRLVSTSLTKSPVIDGAFVDYHEHNLNDGEDKFDLKYRLYAVVVSFFFVKLKILKIRNKIKKILFLQSHSGMLNGGHYISYASNPNNSWYCYNDSSCREIHQQPNIDPSSAYLLFYERQGLNYSPYLPKVDDRPIPNSSVMDIDDSDNELRKMCVIS